MRRFLAAFVLLVAAIPAFAQDAGLITRASRHDHAATIARLEDSIRQAGFTVFTRIDHAVAARDNGLAMPPATVVIFGNPRTGTPAFLRAPTLALDLPLRALVWQNAEGRVAITYTSAAYLFGTVYARHGLSIPAEAVTSGEQLFAGIVARAVE